jgi:hypothetical protein
MFQASAYQEVFLTKILRAYVIYAVLMNSTIYTRADMYDLFGGGLGCDAV